MPAGGLSKPRLWSPEEGSLKGHRAGMPRAGTCQPGVGQNRSY